MKINVIVYNNKEEMEDGAGNGVARDIFAAFWKEVADSLLIGQSHRVPFVRHDLYLNEWEAVGRILLTGCKEYKYFPLVLASAFTCFVLFDAVPDHILLESFYMYLAPDERETLKASIESYDSCNKEELFGVLDRFNCRKQVNAANMKIIIMELARQELVQKPYLMASAIKPFMLKMKSFASFQSPERVHAFYDRVKPTPRKVLDLLKMTERENPSNFCSDMYVVWTQLNLGSCFNFARAQTGSGTGSCAVESIQVTFTRLDGAGRRPIARTCAPLLELPSTYENFCQLRKRVLKYF